MSARKFRYFSSISAVALALCACGGGGGASAFVPQPIPAPPPTPTPSITVFANPTAGVFASVGASAKASNQTDLTTPLGPVSIADANQPHIEYMSGLYYVQLPGKEYDELIPYGHGTAPTVATDSDADILLSLSGSRDKGYKYSELGSYSAAGPLIGAIAFGMGTPDGSVPVTGSATYNGIVAGWSDVIASDSFDGPNRASVEGTVNLNVNFGAGTVGGSMTIGLNDAAADLLPIGTFNFTNGVYSQVSTNYSGKFTSSAAGDNFFLGNFTGPQAEETIGAWALPFTLDVGNSTITADHQTHQAFGAWIAKKP